MSDYDRYSPTASTAYHRAFGASGQPRDIGQGIILSRWSDFSPKSIGTVHTFQGVQKSVIIFSTRQCYNLGCLKSLKNETNFFSRIYTIKK
jgi:hypothetical protein